MINTAARTYFAIAGVAAATAIIYHLAVGDLAGTFLFVFVLLAANLVGLALAGSGVNDRAPFVAADAPPPAQVPVGRAAAPRPSNWPLVIAFAGAIGALGLSYGTPVVIVGLIGALLAAGGWCAQAWREHPSWTPRVGAHVGERLVTPFTLPVAVALLVLALVVCISRVLLAVDEKAAVAVAAVLAMVLLATFAFLASRPRNDRTLLGTLGGVTLLALVAAGVAGAAKGERRFEPAADTNRNVFALVARGTKFNRDSLTVPGGQPITVKFTNDDPGTYHNVAVYTAKEGGKPVAESQPVQGPQKTTYTYTFADPGTFAFRCDFHSNMVGTLTVEPGP